MIGDCRETIVRLLALGWDLSRRIPLRYLLFVGHLVSPTFTSLLSHTTHKNCVAKVTVPRIVWVAAARAATGTTGHRGEFEGPIIATKQ